MSVFRGDLVAGEPDLWVANNKQERVELTILLPCLNESETLEICIRKAQYFLDANHIRGEVLVSDNG